MKQLAIGEVQNIRVILINRGKLKANFVEKRKPDLCQGMAGKTELNRLFSN